MRVRSGSTMVIFRRLLTLTGPGNRDVITISVPDWIEVNVDFEQS